MKVGRYIFSIAERELQQENEDLRKQVERLTAERDKYQDLYHERLQYSPAYTISTRVPKLIESKNYLKPTESSAGRRVVVQTLQSSATRKSLARRTRVEDQRTTTTDELESANAPPESDSDTAGWSEYESQAKSRCDQFQCLCDDRGDGYGCDYRRPSSCFCVLCVGFNTKVDRAAFSNKYPENDLCARTNINGSEYYDTPQGRAYVRFDKLFRLLHAGHRLARDSAWHAFRTYWPEFQRKYFRYGPWQVRFGWKEMAGKLNGEYGVVARNRMPNVYNNVCDMPPAVMNWAILNMVGMRNMLAHPHEISPKEADSLLQRAQELACVLRDEHRAKQIRSLRDELQGLVRNALKEIVDYEPLSHLPGARHWALHHQFLFEDVIRYLHKHNQSAEERRRNDEFLGFKTTFGLTRPDTHYHPAVVAAAITWIAKFQTPGANLHYVIAMPLAQGLPPKPLMEAGQASEEVIKAVQGIGRDEKRKAEREAKFGSTQ